MIRSRIRLTRTVMTTVDSANGTWVRFPAGLEFDATKEDHCIWWYASLGGDYDLIVYTDECEELEET